jgi:hypothetical protein
MRHTLEEPRRRTRLDRGFVDTWMVEGRELNACDRVSFSRKMSVRRLHQHLYLALHAPAQGG